MEAQEQNGQLPERQPAIVIFFDADTQRVDVHHNTNVVKDGGFLLMLLEGAKRVTEEKVAMAKWMAVQKAAMEQQQGQNIRRSIKLP